MTVESISREQWAHLLQKVGKFGTIGGSITTLACAVLGQDYTYPCTITALSACTWVSIRLSQSAAANTPNSKGFIQRNINTSVDAAGEHLKTKLKERKDEWMEAGVTAAKLAMLTSLPLGTGIIAGSMVGLAGESSKGLSNKSIDSFVDSMETSTKTCVGKFFDNSNGSFSSSSFSSSSS